LIDRHTTLFRLPSSLPTLSPPLSRLIDILPPTTPN